MSLELPLINLKYTKISASTNNIPKIIPPQACIKLCFFFSAIYFNEIFFYLNYCATIKSAQRLNLAPI